MADTDTDLDNYQPRADSQLTGSSSTREETQPPDPATDQTWLVGYRVSPGNGTTTLLGFNPALTEVLRRKRWATLIRDQGWVIPSSYLAHIERLLAGADVTLFDVDGLPTPGQREQDDRAMDSRTAAVLAELHAAREAALTDPAAVKRAAAETRRAFAAAIAANHTEETP